MYSIKLLIPIIFCFSSDTHHLPQVTPATTSSDANLPSHDLTLDDPESLGRNLDGATSQVVMSLSWSQGKLGAAFYNITTLQVQNVVC